ncbi:MAG: AsmA family protein, partial [Planctomycetota bacterium]
GVLYEGFPYPVTISDGSVIWDADRLRLTSRDEVGEDAGITFVTPGGGEGTIRGEVALKTVDGVTTLHPSVMVDLENDRLNDLLYAAIPLTDDEKARLGEDSGWPGQRRTRVADFMRQIFRSGDLSYRGTVTSDGQSNLDYDFQVSLRNASAWPTEEFASVIGAPLTVWPEGFGIEDGEGDLRVTPDGIELQRFRARHGSGEITAAGTVTPDENGELQTRLHVNLDQLHLGPYLLQMVPTQWSRRVDDLWSRYQPTGSFRAELDLEREAGSSPALAIRLTPEELRLIVEERPLDLTRTDGHLLLQHGRVSPQNLVLEARIDGQPNGSFELNERSTGLGTGSESALELTWRKGAFESPLILEALRVAGATPIIELYRDL